MVSGSRMSTFCTRARYRFLTEVGPLAFSKVYWTSSAVKGVPSCQVTFGRSLKRHLVGVGLSQLTASLGVILKSGPVKSMSGSRIWACICSPGFVKSASGSRLATSSSCSTVICSTGRGAAGAWAQAAAGAARAAPAAAVEVRKCRRVTRARSVMAMLLSSSRAPWERPSLYMEVRTRCKRGRRRREQSVERDAMAGGGHRVRPALPPRASWARAALSAPHSRQRRESR